MFYREHGVIHFHAEYQGEQATFTFDGEILAGNIRSRTARRLIKEWGLAHGAELEVEPGLANRWSESPPWTEESEWMSFRPESPR